VKIECKFEICQARKDHKLKENLFFMQEIALALESSVKSIREGTHPQYRIRTLNLKSNLLLIEYLTMYPLFGSKFLDYQDRCKVVKLFQKGKFNHKSNLEYVKFVKSHINDRRTQYI